MIAPLIKLLGVLWLMKAASDGGPPSGQYAGPVPIGPSPVPPPALPPAASTRLLPGGSTWKRPGATAPQALPAAPSWPSSPPGTLPPFPQGWEYDVPVPPEVQRRAVALLSQLWSTGEGSYTTELVGGRWITFRAEVVAGGAKGVTAWRVKGTQAGPVSPLPTPGTPPAPALPPAPSVVIPPSPGAPSMQATTTPKQTAAILMNNALTSFGYRKRDQPVYKAYQRAAGLSPIDGFPGRGTMTDLATTLATMGVPIAPVPVYPWSSRGSYDGRNAPTSAQWNS